jgi:hypothetical protein
MQDTPPDNLPDNEAMRWVSFAELAAARGVDKASAIRLVRRRGWRRQRDNQGHVRALVPETWINGIADRPPDSPGDNPPDTFPGLSMHTRALAALEEAVTGLTRRAEQAEQRADAASAAAAAANQRADAADGDRREAVALVEKTLAMLTDERARADRAEAARQKDEALIADLRAKDAQADGLRDRLVGAQTELSLAQAAADRARVEAQAAQDAADTLRQADEARKARGRWARLRAAWRGQ